MNLKEHFSNLDIQEIYKTIIDLEGPKYPYYNWNQLEYAAKYIQEKMMSYGIKTEIQEFYIEGFEQPFKNILGYIGDQSQPAIVLGSHYDTVPYAPGANDNLSGVAVSLELARVLCQLENPPSMIIAVFTLEEGYPTYYKRLIEALRQKGLLDDKDSFLSLEMMQFDRQLSRLVGKKHRDTRKPLSKVYDAIIKEYKDEFDKRQVDYVHTVKEIFKETDELFVEKKVPLLALVGSTMFVQKALKENIKIKYVINYDTLGWISNEEGTQKPLPITEEMLPLTTSYKMDLKGTIGNFIAVIANHNAKQILDEYINQCSHSEIDMPCFGLYLPFDIDRIYVAAPDTLRSDHAPFWAENIPGIFITDTGNFRSPYYHTAEDKHHHIDYQSLKKITMASLGLILSL